MSGLFELRGTGEIQCEKCSSIFGVDGADVFVHEVGEEERDMGMEIFISAHSIVFVQHAATR